MPGQAPDRFATAPILGWRTWRLELGPPPRLRPSFFMNEYVWQPGMPFVATCVAFPVSRHEPPGRTCACGIYGFKEREQAEAYRAPAVGGLLAVYGQVSLWGRVIEHELGYRAERAYPYAIYVPTEILVANPMLPEDDAFQYYLYDPDGVASRLRREYQVDVEVVR